MEGRAGALSQIPHLTFAHSPTPFPPAPGLPPPPGRSPHLTDQGDKDQQTKVDMDFTPSGSAGERPGHQNMEESRGRLEVVSRDKGVGCLVAVQLVQGGRGRSEDRREGRLRVTGSQEQGRLTAQEMERQGHWGLSLRLEPQACSGTEHPQVPAT